MGEPLTVLDLFSGIGGFSLGLERTGGFKTVAFCEIDLFCRRVLAKHWPEVPCYDDVRALKGFKVDVVCGGFPCQPYSTASRGLRRGARDDRALWPEMRRLVQESKPAWVIGENVAGFEAMDFADMVSDLEALGYEIATFEIPACAVGHDHKRTRLWICAYADQGDESDRSINAKTRIVPGHREPIAGHPRGSNGISARMDRRRGAALGNAVVPQIPELIGRAILAAIAP